MKYLKSILVVALMSLSLMACAQSGGTSATTATNPEATSTLNKKNLVIK